MEDINPLMSLIDTLHLGFYLSEIKLTEDDFKRLDEGKQLARESGIINPGLFEFKGKQWDITSNRKIYSFVLYNGDVTIKIARKLSGGAYPEIFVEFRSRLLLGGLLDAYLIVRQWIEQWAVISSEKVSRADITTDFEGAIQDFNIVPENVVKRSKKRRDHYEPVAFDSNYFGLKLTGYTFGSGDLLLRIYDKTLEVKQKGIEYILPEWEKQGWNRASPITRVEFQLRRAMLKEFKIETVQNLIDHAPDLWKYLTTEWFTVRVPSESDKTRSRWPIAETWKIVVDSFSRFGELSGVVREKIKQVTLENLIPQASGLITSVMALMIKKKMDITELLKTIEINYKKKGKTIEDVVREKMGRYALFEESAARLLQGMS